MTTRSGTANEEAKRPRRPKSKERLRTWWLPRAHCPGPNGCGSFEYRAISVRCLGNDVREQYVECRSCGNRYYVMHAPGIHAEIS